VTVIDGATNQVITTVAVDSGPLALCYNPKNNKVYVANSGSNNVTVIDGATDSVSIVVPVGVYPRVFCCNPQNNKVYCANGYNSSVTVIDDTTGLVITTVPVGAYPDALCYNSQNDKVYCSGVGSLTVIDGATDSVIATVAAGEGATALCYNWRDDKVYCTSDNSMSLAVIEGETDSIVARVGIGFTYGLCYSPLHDEVYVTVNQSVDPVLVIGGKSDTVVGWFSLGGGDFEPHVFAYNPGSNLVYGVDPDDVAAVAVFTDSGGTGVREERQMRKVESGATIVRGVLEMPLTAYCSPLTASLLDISGRKVLDLKPGANDISRLAPGVYFVRERPQTSSPKPQATWKVVLTK
jgi:YVTN family beta-propeller protein